MVVIIISFVIAFYIKSFLEHRRLEELYSRFSNYMKETVDYHLSLIDCKPKKFYFEDSAVCFVCDIGNACFGYAWTTTMDGDRMNPAGKPSLVYDQFDVKVADFYTHGLASKFNCTKEGADLRCSNGIVMRADGGVKMLLWDSKEFEDVASIVCEHFSEGTPMICDELNCRCGVTEIALDVETNELIYHTYAWL